MLTVTVRFYLTFGGVLSALVLLLRISFTLGGFKRAFEDHIKADQEMFRELGLDVRELRARRR